MQDGIDYKQIESGLRSIADKYGGVNVSQDKSPFRNSNMMTNNVISRRKMSNGVWFELSYGRGFTTNWIVGVTFRDNAGKGSDNMSECVNEFEKVEDMLKNASKL